MKFFQQNTQDKPIILNFSQTHKYEENHVAGVLADQNKIGRDPFKELSEGGVTRTKVHWHPRDVKNPEHTDNLLQSYTRHIHRIPPGVVSPRGVIILNPDQFHELPNDMQKGSMGVFYKKLYESQGYKDLLEMAIKYESDIYSKVERAMKNSQLDDELAMQRIRQLEQIKQAVDAKGKKSS
ncbi:hypothetical protein OB919_15765 [Halobacteria archaeon AArc-curdl1]|uniref:Uncharacterized protein n=1 Tax=Natronosalvus hydrolyticus TaxID=2979988 RepID=A0AAP2Z9X7_9EURY|nr:hypothetical protein [Halobacteria archaeon AArc-curdl1]